MGCWAGALWLWVSGLFYKGARFKDLSPQSLAPNPKPLALDNFWGVGCMLRKFCALISG